MGCIKVFSIGLRKWRMALAFTPPAGKLRTGRVRGEYSFALTVVQRGIEDRGDQAHAA